MAQAYGKPINPASVHQPLGPYSMAMQVSAGRLLIMAGQVAVDIAGDPVGIGDVVAQTRQVYQNLGKVLESAGASFGNVVDFTVYVVGRETCQGFWQARAEIFPEIFPSGDYPPSTLLVIDGLAQEEFLVEIKAVAALP